LKRHSNATPALFIVLPYLILGALWILFSDRLLLIFADKPQAMVTFSTAKGWFYVLITSLLLFSLVYRELHKRSALEAKLRDGISEKGALLAELNHRVKNNLQVIASILNLEAEGPQSGEARALNDRTQARIRAMGIAYERLFEGGELARLDLSGYLRDIWTVMTQIYDSPEAEAHFDVEAIVVGADEAVPFGLFATEAITNAILYGRSSTGRSEVWIGLHSPEPGIVEFCIRDRGPGMPLGAEGLGLRLMDALGAQLRGRVEQRNEEGALIRLRFAALEQPDG
jgi:two-component sensor histidine kinase